MTVNDDVSLLQEYTQWVATKSVSTPDTSPEEFMRDRIKEVAMDRINNALEFLQAQEDPLTVEGAMLREILEGAYEYNPEEGVATPRQELK